MVTGQIDTCISKNVQGNSLIKFSFSYHRPPAQERVVKKRYGLIIQVQEAFMNISATKQDIFIKLEQKFK